MKTKSFNLKRFGFKFRIFITDEKIAACIVRVPGDKIDRPDFNIFVGTAKVNKPDIYNYEIGKRIAMKSAINQYSSYKTGKDIESINGFKSRMFQINNKLRIELLMIR